MERLTRDGNAVKLIGKRRGTEQEVARGTWDAESDVITLVFPSRGGNYDFIRDNDGSAFYLLLAVAALMLITGFLAALGPARRSLRIQPMEALRTDG